MTQPGKVPVYTITHETWNGTAAVYTWFSDDLHRIHTMRTPEDIAATELVEFVNEAHMDGDGEPLGYTPAEGQYRVRIWEGDEDVSYGTTRTPLATAVYEAKPEIN